MGMIVKHEMPSNGWPEVLLFVQQLVTSENLTEKEVLYDGNIFDVIVFIASFNSVIVGDIYFINYDRNCT